jgi:hypothetical protein
VRQPPGASDFFQAGFESRANGRQMFWQVSRTMGSRRDSVKFMPQSY